MFRNQNILSFTNTKVLLLFVVLFSFFSPLYSQQPAYFKLGEEEFSGIQIYDVIQDNDLNYWFATDQGFYKYDNYKFETVECKEMKDFSAFGFVKTSDGTIYCHNLNKQILKIEKGICSVYYDLQDEEYSKNISLAISKENNLIVISKNSLIFTKAGVPIKQKTISSGFFGTPFKIKQGLIISHIPAQDSLLVFDDTEAQIKPIVNNGGTLKNALLSFFRIKENTYAVDTRSKQFFLFDENTYRLTALPQTNSFEQKEQFRFYITNNLLWVVSPISGLSLLSSPENMPSNDKLFSNYFISDVYEDDEGNVLLSTFNGGVLVIPHLKVPDIINPYSESPIVSIVSEGGDGVIMGTSKGELLQFQNNQYTALSVSGAKPLKSIHSWKNVPFILFDDGTINVYSKKAKKTTNLFEASLKGAVQFNDSIFYLSLNVGVVKLQILPNSKFNINYIERLKTRTNTISIEPNTKKVFIATADGLKILHNDTQIENVFLNSKQVFVNSFSTDSTYLYAATKKNGVLVFNNGKIVRQLFPQMDQKNIELFKLIVHKDKIFATTSKGFVVMDTNGVVEVRFNMAYGFLTNNIFDFELTNNELWISHTKGVQRIDLNLLKKQTTLPTIKILTIKINDVVFKNHANEIAFDSDKHKFQFILSSPTLKNKETIVYHYKLIGYEEKWNISTYFDNEVTYNSLSPGSYTFTVKAENQGLFSEAKSFSFQINPPIYLRWWFMSLIVLLFLLIVFIVYRWQLKIQQKKADQINELNASKLTAIQSQMNPHFIFNSLNSVQDLILKGDVEHSYTYITTFSNLVRRTLNYSEKDFIDFEQEIKLLELYLSLEKLRFKKQFNYEIIYSEINDIMLPPLLIQPFIENSLVHGLLHKSGAKNLKITFELKEVLICTIEDNGVGREKAKAIKQRQRSEHESFSGRAIKKRFEILSNVFGGKFGYEYEDLYENDEACGTKVVLMIPVKHKF